LLAAGSFEEQKELAVLVRERGMSVRSAEEMMQSRRTTPARGAAKVENPALAELQRRLETKLGTRVRLHARKADGSTDASRSSTSAPRSWSACSRSSASHTCCSARRVAPEGFVCGFGISA
jgi:hypothetical protein